MRRPRTVQAIAAVAVLVGSLATGQIALARVKPCSRISGCTTALVQPTPVGAGSGGSSPPATPSSHFGITVATPPKSTATTGKQSGKLVEKLNTKQISCPGYQLRDTTTFEFQLLTSNPLKITYVIVDRISNTTADGIHFCLAANFPFKTLSGAPAAATVLPDGTRGHAGLLPQCANALVPAGAATAPCVVQTTTVKDASSSTGVDVILRVRVPVETKGDPWGGG